MQLASRRQYESRRRPDMLMLEGRDTQEGVRETLEATDLSPPLHYTNINDPGGIGVWSYIHQPEPYACMAESPAGFLADDDYHVSPRRAINE